MKKKLLTGVLACGLAGLILSGCAEPKPKPDTREKAKRSHDELEQEEEQMKERKKEMDHSKLEQAAPQGGELASAPSSEAPGGVLALMASPGTKPSRSEPCAWIEAEGSVALGENDTMHQAKARAIAVARKEAVKNVLGYEIRSRDAVFQQELLRGEQTLVESLLVSTQYGLILDEKVLSAGPGPRGTKYAVKLKTCVARQPEKMDKGFRVMLDLNRQTFVEGDEAVAEITATRDACVYLINVDTQGNMAVVFPNSHAAENCTAANRKLMYPDPRLQRLGVHLKALLPPGARTSTETLKVVAFKTKMDHLFAGAGVPANAASGDLFEKSESHNTGEYGTFLKRLVMEDVEWVEDTAAFVIHAK